MAKYKVPQDVEADDKLIGPFGFRQFVYLLIAGGLAAVAVGLFQIFPLLAIIPVPPILLFAALALPLKKDQPMETYLAAVVSYYLKPRNRIWMPGQKENPITITAPKKVDNERVRDITGEEATHRLSFLAEIVDTEGQAIKWAGASGHANMELAMEATQTRDMFESSNFNAIQNTINQDEYQRHAEVVQEMRNEIRKNEVATQVEGGQKPQTLQATINKPNFNSSVVVKPDLPKEQDRQVNPNMVALANNEDYTVATIAKEAKRIKEKEKGEVFVSLH